MGLPVTVCRCSVLIAVAQPALIASRIFLALSTCRWSSSATGMSAFPKSAMPSCLGSSTTISPLTPYQDRPREPILKAVPRRLHLQPDHPISITRQLIESHFPDFQPHNTLCPVVSVHQNFDSLGFSADHPGRGRSDTYYINKNTVLRTHTSAHQADMFQAATSSGYLVSADVYRRDAVDRSHYPVFHQMEGAMTWNTKQLNGYATIADSIRADVEKLCKYDIRVEDANPTVHPVRNPMQPGHAAAAVEAVAMHLKRSLERVVFEIFNQASRTGAAAEGPLRVRWVEAYFPFTSPSWELEVLWHGEWLELLGCGVVQQAIFDNARVPDRIGWAFGLGLERIAMLLYSIPDIRLFWSKDSRFLGQFKRPTEKSIDHAIDFKNWGINRFQPFSKYPTTPRDVAFWLPGKVKRKGGFSHAAMGNPSQPQYYEAPETHENDVMEIVREVGGDVVEDVKLIDEFVHPTKMRLSRCYRINYRSLERTLTGEEVNKLHCTLMSRLVERLGVEAR